MFKKIIILVVLAVLFAACNNENLSTKQGMIDFVDKLYFDFGEINIEGGLVEKDFRLFNDSSDPLNFVSAFTTCGCTEAEVVYKGKVSPRFGMHANPDWNFEIPGGEEFIVKVIYDPMAHGPEATGAVNRSVLLETSSLENGRVAVNDPTTGLSLTQINIQGEVVLAKDYQGEQDAK